VANLKVKQNLLEKFNLPVSIKEGWSNLVRCVFNGLGYIGRLVLSLPWTNLSNQSAVVRVSDIFLVVSAEEDNKVCTCQVRPA
jgi:hypothetical protein